MAMNESLFCPPEFFVFSPFPALSSCCLVFIRPLWQGSWSFRLPVMWTSSRFPSSVSFQLALSPLFLSVNFDVRACYGSGRNLFAFTRWADWGAWCNPAEKKVSSCGDYLVKARGNHRWIKVGMHNIALPSCSTSNVNRLQPSDRCVGAPQTMGATLSGVYRETASPRGSALAVILSISRRWRVADEV